MYSRVEAYATDVEAMRTRAIGGTTLPAITPAQRGFIPRGFETVLIGITRSIRGIGTIAE